MHELSKNFVILQPISTNIIMESLQWLINLFTATDSVAHITLLYAVVIATGVYLGKIKIGAHEDKRGVPGKHELITLSYEIT